MLEFILPSIIFAVYLCKHRCFNQLGRSSGRSLVSLGKAGKNETAGRISTTSI